MVSRTKYELMEEQIEKIFSVHGIHDIKSIEPLGAGEFNCVYEVVADKPYVLKVAPENKNVLTYEQDMIKSEIYWYEMMREHTDITVPQVYFSDFTKEIIPVNYFVMEKVIGTQKDKTKFADKERANNEVIKMIAKIHKVKGEKFGYIQSGLSDNWYDAYRAIVSNLIADCKKAGKETERGEKLLLLTEKYRDALMSAESAMVNFDAWDPNFICTDKEKYEFTWIDPERNFWGDRIFDFICIDMAHPIEKKEKALEVYNSVADEPIKVTENEIIRYAFAQGLAGLIMEVEKYYRYTPTHFGWMRNVAASAMFYRNAFTVLE